MTTPPAPPSQCALNGLHCTNAFGVFPLDRLHQDANGVTKYLIELAIQGLTAKERTALNAKLLLAKRRGAPRLPSDGLDAELMCAEERLAIVKVLPWASQGIIDQDSVDLLAREHGGGGRGGRCGVGEWGGRRGGGRG